MAKPNEGFMYNVMDYFGLWRLFIVLSKNGWLQMAFSKRRKMSCKCKREAEPSLLHFTQTANTVLV